MIYRTSQISTLGSALQPLNNLITQILSPYPQASSSFSSGDPKIISLEQAYSLLTHHMPSISTTVHRFISEDQEEELPLDWSILLEDWSFTYWTLWIYIMMLHGFDEEVVAAIHPKLGQWIRNAISSPSSSPHPSHTFHGAPDEHSTLTQTINQLKTHHPSLFSQHPEQTTSHEPHTHLLNLASYLVKEQAFTVPYEMLDGAAKGEKIEQLVLCVWGK